jgi:hypothetical protein
MPGQGIKKEPGPVGPDSHNTIIAQKSVQFYAIFSELSGPDPGQVEQLEQLERVFLKTIE